MFANLSTDLLELQDETKVHQVFHNPEVSPNPGDSPEAVLTSRAVPCEAVHDGGVSGEQPGPVLVCRLEREAVHVQSVWNLQSFGHDILGSLHSLLQASVPERLVRIQRCQVRHHWMLTVKQEKGLKQNLISYFSLLFQLGITDFKKECLTLKESPGCYWDLIRNI